jgi:ABC-2 type transport system permease protein
MLLLVAAGKLVYHVRFEGNALNVLAAFTLSSLSFFGLGFILAGLLPTARTAQIVGMVLLYPMLFLSGAGFPRELLPESIKKISTFLPLTYVVNLLRGMWIGEPWSQHSTNVIVLAAMLVVGLVISIRTFRWE